MSNNHPIEIIADRFPNIPKAMAHAAERCEETGRVVDIVTADGEWVRRVEPRRAN